MKAAFLSYKSSEIHYRYRDGGKSWLLCFHGYGETSESFQFLEPFIPGSISLLAIDLPFHGKTNWKEGPECTPDQLLQLLQELGMILGFSGQPVQLLGYSMGGRLALRLLQAQPALVTRLILLAPDGLKQNFWYWLATQTWLGNQLFRFTIRQPAWFFLLLRGSNRLGLLNRSIYKFVTHFVTDRQARYDLYRRWTGFRQITPNIPLLKQYIARQQIPVHLIYGRYDRIILPNRGEAFCKGLEAYCKLHLINSGHQLLLPKNARFIGSLLST